MTATERRFLFLQGPHGPFFGMLGRRLREAGAEVWRVGFNAGDEVFWGERASFIAYRGRPEDWPAACARLLQEKAITDLVLYGDTRPVHAAAIVGAKAAGIRVHVLEEGYLRPWWATYERGGSNGNSRLMELTLEEMRAALGPADAPQREAPARWGELRQHVFYGALYHFFVLALSRRYPHYRTHRDVPVAREFALHLRRFLATPWLAAQRRLRTWRLLRGARPFHLALLQLDHDANYRSHGPYPDTRAFLDHLISAFASGAPAHHQLVCKAHPLEDGRVPLPRLVAELARRHGVRGRVHYLPGGKLAQVVGAARSAITVNSTAAHQALWRGIPVKCMGRAVYARPGIVSSQPLAEFFANPQPPDPAAYHDFRRFLLQTSQIPGGFYASTGRHALMRELVDLMLAPADPYSIQAKATASPRQQLRAIN